MNDLYLSGYVERFHTNPFIPAQTLGHHQFGCVAILYKLFPDASRELILATLFHDAGECVTGDLPWDFKRKFPTTAEKISETETWARDEMIGHIPLSPSDHAKVKLCDRIDAWLWASITSRETERQDWIEQRRDIEAGAMSLGVHDKVVEMLENI